MKKKFKSGDIVRVKSPRSVNPMYVLFLGYTGTYADHYNHKPICSLLVLNDLDQLSWAGEPGIIDETWVLDNNEYYDIEVLS